ncbi:hypothetical protein L208DRAFT_1060869, partial [Tricholoma matsutake]
MTKIINSLSAKMEIGSPMACMYLLGNPDHYTNYSFIPFYWKSFKAIEDHDLEVEQHEKVAIFKHKGHVIGLSPVHDYVIQPAEFHSMCLYDWISRHQCKK